MVIDSIINKIIIEFIAIMGGVVVAYCVNVLDDYFIKSRREFINLMEETAFTLINEARYYSNPISRNELNERAIIEYCRSADEMRMIASKLKAFSKLHKRSFCKVSSKEVYEASTLLMAVSNSYFGDDYTLSNIKKVGKVGKILKIELE